MTFTLCNGPNRFLSQLESSLVNDFNLLLDQEAIFWSKKSRVQWLQEGDRNMKFFHMSTIIRRTRNRVERLKNENGDWVYEVVGLKTLALNYFSNLFSQGQVVCFQGHIPKLFLRLETMDISDLMHPVDLSEVQSSLFNIGSGKAPGVDGFRASFYQNHWSLCASDVVCKVFQKGHVLERLNEALITLVPKVANPQNMAQFQPISLCCTLYKVISKIIVARMRSLMSKLIIPHQISFVPAQITLLLLRRLCISFKFLWGEKGFFCLESGFVKGL